jgi:hypothetical protein
LRSKRLLADDPAMSSTYGMAGSELLGEPDPVFESERISQCPIKLCSRHLRYLGK